MRSSGSHSRRRWRSERWPSVGCLPCPQVVSSAAQAPAPPAQLFRDITRDAGITFQHHAAPEKKYIVESMSGGRGALRLRQRRPARHLLRRLADGRHGRATRRRRAARSTGISARRQFEDVTDKAGVGHPGWGMGVCTADVDGDGWEDLYVTALGGNKLYRNNHDGTFADSPPRAGVAAGGWSAGCGFADYDRDGDLDLFVSRYVKIDLANLPQFGKDKTCEYRGIAVQCGPRGLPGESDFLFRNDGNGRFTEVSEKAGVSRSARLLRPRHRAGSTATRTAGRTCTSPTIRRRTSSIINQKDGTFKEVAFPMGVAVSEDGAEQGSMGVAVGDYDNSGRFSILVDEFLGGIQRALPQRRRSLHRRSFRRRPPPAACRSSAGATRSSTTTTTGCST